MLNFLMRNKYSPIALDIGAGGVHMIQLKQSGGRLTAAASAKWKFPPEALTDPLARRELLVEAVRDIRRRRNFHGRAAVTAMPTSRLCIKNIRLPHMPPPELRKAALWEAKERFGFEVAQDQISLLNAGQVRQGAETRDEIILIACQPGAVEQQLALLDDMGLSAMSVEAEPLALFRSFERFLRRTADEAAVTVVLEIGQSGSRVVVARGRQIVFIKFIEIGGRKFTEAVVKQLNLSFDEASELRQRLMRESAEMQTSPATDRKGSSNVRWTVHDALRAEVEALAREVGLCLRYCSVTFRGLRCEKVAVVGGEAYDPSVVELLSEHLGMECVVSQPLRGVDTSGVDVGNDRRGVLAEWAVAAGMAIRDLDGLADAKDMDDPEPQRISA